MAKLTEEQFQKGIASLKIGERGVELTRAVLVQGLSQPDAARQFGVTKGAVCKQVGRVLEVLGLKPGVPRGYQKVTAILPEHQAFTVRKWADEAKKKMTK